ncbi:hypothetical protein Dda_5912 [Drechslerella dactyloides]|uniref:Gamma interferon inducible lysosomal thiol reductase n=1 Tax=Drechslerella dactyloides TaxID=74499 RepID=A0AAD6NGR4_DREDA|nr:hypothetical protein Dda_5912 [Drechslerella dactyloides]
MRTPSNALCLLAPLLLTSHVAAMNFEAVHINGDGKTDGLPPWRLNSVVRINGEEKPDGLPPWRLNSVVRTNGAKSPIPVEMFTMSKCPDARDCVADLVLPTMAKLFDSGKITLKPTYIGTPDDSTGGIACMHGEGECLGNILQLCAYELYKPEPKRWLGFTYCMGQKYRQIPDPAFVESCAREHGMDMKKVSDCASSTEPNQGVELLRTSARRAMSLKVKTSCTIAVQGKTVCVRDGGQWKAGCNGSVDELVQLIESAYNKQ